MVSKYVKITTCQASLSRTLLHLAVILVSISQTLYWIFLWLMFRYLA